MFLDILSYVSIRFTENHPSVSVAALLLLMMYSVADHHKRGTRHLPIGYYYSVYCASEWRLHWLAPRFGEGSNDFSEQLNNAERLHTKALLKCRTYWKTLQSISEHPDDIDAMSALSLPGVVGSLIEYEVCDDRQYAWSYDRETLKKSTCH